MRRVPIVLILSLLLTACGSTSAAIIPKVHISGVVSRQCSGPLIVGRQQPCSDVAVLTVPGHHYLLKKMPQYKLHGAFSVMIPSGKYYLDVDNCEQPEITITHSERILFSPKGCAVAL